MRRILSLVSFVGLISICDAQPSQQLLHATHDARPLNIAIIGAGAAGSSTAYHLAQFAQEACVDVNITVFEKESYVGGRSTTVNAYNDPTLPLELGASIFVKVNRILVDAARRFNLSTSSFGPAHTSALADSPSLGIWDGKQFILKFSPSGPNWWDTAKILFRYGLAPIRSRSAMKATIGKFLQMYNRPVFPFESLTAAAEQVDLLDATSSTGVVFLTKHAISKSFAHDIIQASSRVNYAQNLQNFHGLETMVCLATDDASAIVGGNWQIFHAMINASHASLLLDTHVDHIERDKQGRYALTYSDAVQTFDHVVLAAPFQYANVRLAKHVEPPVAIDYVKLHVTLFTSPYKIDPTFFGLLESESVPLTILTTVHCAADEAACFHDNSLAPEFFSISTLTALQNPKTGTTEYAYKIFSSAAPSMPWLMSILGMSTDTERSQGSAITWIRRKVWHSYPYETPRAQFEKILLAEGLWYTAGMESFISTMETNALMGKNIAKLIIDTVASEALSCSNRAS